MHKAVEAIRKCFGSLLSTLSTLANDDAMAKGLYKSIHCYKFVVFTYGDILGDLTYLSCYFQQDNLDFSQVQSAVEATISNIRDTYLDGDAVGGEHLTYIIGELTNPVIFEDHEIVCRSSDEQQCFTSIRMFAEAVIANIEERFPDLAIWSSLKIFDPVSYPTRATQLRGFGKQDMQTLMDHFGKPKVVNSKEYKEVIDPSLLSQYLTTTEAFLLKNWHMCM